MKTRNLAGLAVVAAVVVIGAIVAVEQREPERSDRLVQKTLFPDLMDRVNEVAEITVTHAGESYVIAPVDGVWALPGKGGYPVRYEKVKQTVLALAEAETVEAKTDDPARFAALGLGDPDSADSESTLIELADADGNAVAAIVLGDSREGVAGFRYVRRPDENQTWLARLETDAGGTPLDWIERTVIEIGRDRIARVRITHPDGETVTIERTEGEGPGGFDLVELPEGRELRTPYALGAIVSALMTVRIDDVAPVDSIDFGTDPTIARYETADGLVVTVTTVEDDETVWGHFTAAYDPTLVAEPPSEGDAEAAEAAAAPDAEGEAEESGDAEKDVAAEAAEIDSRLSAWAYALPSQEWEPFRQRLEDLLRPVEEPDPTVQLGPSGPGSPEGEAPGESPLRAPGQPTTAPVRQPNPPAERFSE